MNLKPQLHVSHLNMLARCGVQFQRRYGKTFGVGVANEIIPPSTAAGVGTAVHASVELNLKRKLAGEETSLDHAQAVARDKFVERWEEGLLLSKDEEAAPDKAKDAAIDQSVALSTVHFERVAPDILPIAVEKPFVIELDSFPVDLSGRIDIVENGSKPGRVVLRDTKTIKASPSAGAARTMQTALYSQAIKLETGELPETVSLDHLVKTKTPKAVTVSMVPDDGFIRPVLHRVERAVEIIEAVRSGRQAFSPAVEDSWICSSRYCGYAATCPFWGGRE